MVGHHARDRTSGAHDPWVVALTGGVAAGKSAVAERFRALGVAVHDADDAAREAVAPGSAGLEDIVRAFGPGVLDGDGTLDRKAMRRRVFDDDDARRRLEGIVHPAVRDLLRQRVHDTRGPYSMLAIPLLAETWPQYDWVDRVLVVDAPDEVRLARLMRRDDIDATLAGRMLASQVSRERRLELADDVIDNSGGPERLDAVVRNLHETYLDLATQARR
jgi:dephospho-CoA kinase